MGAKARNIRAIVPFNGNFVTEAMFEEIRTRINLDFDKCSGFRFPHRWRFRDLFEEAC